MATPGFDLKAALSNLSHATNEGLEQALDVVQGYVTPLSDTINSALQDIGIAQSPSSMTSRARDRVERNFASLRWQYMDSLRLPLQQPPVWDARMLLTLANLGNVLVNQANHYRESTSVPITTIVLLLSSTATFCHPGGVLMRDVCLSPFCVVERWAQAQALWLRERCDGGRLGSRGDNFAQARS